MPDDTEIIRAALDYLRASSHRPLSGDQHSEALAALDRLEQERGQLIEQITSGRAGEQELMAENVALRGRLQAAEQERDEARKEMWRHRGELLDATRVAERLAALETALRREIRYRLTEHEGWAGELDDAVEAAFVAELSVSPAPTPKRPIQKRGGYQPTASGPAPTAPPPKPGAVFPAPSEPA